MLDLASSKELIGDLISSSFGVLCMWILPYWFHCLKFSEKGILIDCYFSFQEVIDSLNVYLAFLKSSFEIGDYGITVL